MPKRTKTQLIAELATVLGTTKAETSKFIDTYADVLTAALKADGEVTVPGLVKIVLKDKPATEERMAMNPFTKKMAKVAAKPASKKVAARPLSPLKKAVG